MTHSGRLAITYYLCGRCSVLIPLLLDDPLWANYPLSLQHYKDKVLIPLLLDDPLWEFKKWAKQTEEVSLNPSFAG